jgi:hypothetical protein
MIFKKFCSVLLLAPCVFSVNAEELKVVEKNTEFNVYSTTFNSSAFTENTHGASKRTEQNFLKIILIVLIFFNYKPYNNYCTPNKKYQYW